MRQLQFCFGAVEIGVGKSDGEAGTSIEQLIVVEIIVDATVEDIYIQFDRIEKASCSAEFEIITVRRLHRQAEKIRVEGSYERRTGEQNIFEKRSLKNAIVGSVQNETDRWEKTREGQTRA